MREASGSIAQDLKDLHADHHVLALVLLRIVKRCLVVAKVAPAKAHLRTDSAAIHQDLELDACAIWTPRQGDCALATFSCAAAVGIEGQLHVSSTSNAKHRGGHAEVLRELAQLSPIVWQA